MTNIIIQYPTSYGGNPTANELVDISFKVDSVVISTIRCSLSALSVLDITPFLSGVYNITFVNPLFTGLDSVDYLLSNVLNPSIPNDVIDVKIVTIMDASISDTITHNLGTTNYMVQVIDLTPGNENTVIKVGMNTPNPVRASSSVIRLIGMQAEGYLKYKVIITYRR